MSAGGFEALLNDFLLESRERINRIEGLLLSCEEASEEAREEILIQAKRELHTLKGNSGMMGFRNLQTFVHHLEDQVEEIDPKALQLDAILTGLDQLRDVVETTVAGPLEAGSGQKEGGEASHSLEAAGSIRVPFAALDTLMDLLAEMVIFRNRLSDSIGRGKAQSNDPAWEEVEGSQESLNKTLSFLQKNIMNLRMVPLKTLFGSLKRIVHDESVKESKQVRLETSGGETPMDKALLEVANEALGHLVRNAIIHGIEAPHIREGRGKPPHGRIRLSASTHANEVEIDVRDDGAGIDRAALLRKAKERGLDVAAVEDLSSLLFVPGISTREDSDLSSGRGIGLSAAVKAVQRMGGRLEVSSQQNEGTLFRLHLPLSVSITRALILGADSETYALPMNAVVDCYHFKDNDAHQINHAGVLQWRKKVVTLLDAGYIFRTSRTLRPSGYVIIIEVDKKFRGLIVDEISGIREIVVKALDPVMGAVPGISGSTILGDGRVILILDPAGLMQIRPFLEESA